MFVESSEDVRNKVMSFGVAGRLTPATEPAPAAPTLLAQSRQHETGMTHVLAAVEKGG